MTGLSPKQLQVLDEPQIFPQELSDSFIEYLHDDLVSLKHCSLVSRAWLYSSRIHLFRYLSLNTVKMESFIEFTKCSPPTVSPHVRHLYIAESSRYFLDVSLRRALLPQFASTLTHLYLCNSVFHIFMDVLNIVCTFSCLQSLSLENVRWSKNDSPGTTPALNTKSIPRSLIQLRLRQTHLRQIISWILSHKEIPMVSSLDIGPVEERHTMHVGKYLRILGSSLKHLTFMFGFGQVGHVCMFQQSSESITDNLSVPIADYHKSIAVRFKNIFGIDLCHNIRSVMNLRSVHIDNFICSVGVDKGSSSFWAPRLLASLQSLDLRTVVLGVSLSRVGDLNHHDIKWQFLDEVFTSASYANVTSVTFSVSGRVNLDNLACFIRPRLPQCSERGLLRFVKEAPVKAATSPSSKSTFHH